jgi:hypothetical protein
MKSPVARYDRPEKLAEAMAEIVALRAKVAVAERAEQVAESRVARTPGLPAVGSNKPVPFETRVRIGREPTFIQPRGSLHKPGR